MSDGNERLVGAHCVEALRSGAMQPKLWGTGDPYDFDVAPEDAERASCTEGFHGGFLGGEPAGQVLGRIFASQAVRRLSVREHPFDEPVPIPCQQPVDPTDRFDVDTDGDDVVAVALGWGRG